MSFNRPTLTELRDRAIADLNGALPGADSRLRRSVLSVLAKTHAGAMYLFYGALSWVARQLMPDTAEAEHLARWAAIWGVDRKAASGSSGTVSVTGVDGAIVPAGSQLRRVDGTSFRTTAAVTIGVDGALAPVQSIDVGAASVTPAGTALQFSVPVSGVNVAAVAGVLTGGADEESDDDLLARLLTRIRTPPNGGAAADWVAWALAFGGVTRAWSFPGWMGPGTVGVTCVFDGREDILPLEADLDALTAYLEPLRPVTATAVLFAPQPAYVNPVIRVSPDTPEIRAAITAELIDLFRREAKPGGTMYFSRMVEAISLAAGEHNHLLLSPATNLTFDAPDMPTLGDIAWD